MILFSSCQILDMLKYLQLDEFAGEDGDSDLRQQQQQMWWCYSVGAE